MLGVEPAAVDEEDAAGIGFGADDAAGGLERAGEAGVEVGIAVARARAELVLEQGAQGVVFQADLRHARAHDERAAQQVAGQVDSLGEHAAHDDQRQQRPLGMGRELGEEVLPGEFGHLRGLHVQAHLARVRLERVEHLPHEGVGGEAGQIVAWLFAHGLKHQAGERLHGGIPLPVAHGQGNPAHLEVLGREGGGQVEQRVAVRLGQAHQVAIKGQGRERGRKQRRAAHPGKRFADVVGGVGAPQAHGQMPVLGQVERAVVPVKAPTCGQEVQHGEVLLPQRAGVPGGLGEEGRAGLLKRLRSVLQRRGQIARGFLQGMLGAQNPERREQGGQRAVKQMLSPLFAPHASAQQLHVPLRKRRGEHVPHARGQIVRLVDQQ